MGNAVEIDDSGGVVIGVGVRNDRAVLPVWIFSAPLRCVEGWLSKSGGWCWYGERARGSSMGRFLLLMLAFVLSLASHRCPLGGVWIKRVMVNWGG